MLKKFCIKKLTITLTSLLIVLLIYFFPKSEKKEENIIFTSNNNNYIFLLDNNNLVARTDTYLENDVKEKIKSVIDTLTINSGNKDKIKNGFKGIIPENTKLISYTLDKGLLKIDFSKELLNITSDMEEKMIEAITYSLTNIEEVKEIMIYVEGEKLNYLPNSKKILPLTLNRDYGINKIYDIDNLKDVAKTTVYFNCKHDNYHYYVPVTIYNSNNKEKIEVIIEELQSQSHNKNLLTFVSTNLELEKYMLLENELSLYFNKYILDSFNESDILEEVKYSILLSIKDNYDINKVIFNVSDMEILNFDLKTLE